MSKAPIAGRKSCDATHGGVAKMNVDGLSLRMTAGSGRSSSDRRGRGLYVVTSSMTSNTDGMSVHE